MKRLFDVVLSALALAVLSPVFAVVAVLIYRQDGAPVFYCQTRIGLEGKAFGMYKFRSMVKNADQVGSHSTAAHDKRITLIGRFIRKTSIDELPQLVNVLKGDMSLVGPRPDVPAQQKNYTPDQWQKRTSVRPGITGLAQATKRSAATPEERLALDLDYAANHSFSRDLEIIWLTAQKVVSARGSN